MIFSGLSDVQNSTLNQSLVPNIHGLIAVTPFLSTSLVLRLVLANNRKFFETLNVGNRMNYAK